MSSRKEAVEINCSSCSTEFRLWVPEELLSEWGEGEEIGCVKCGARFLVKRGVDGVEAHPIGEDGKTTSSDAAPSELEGRQLLFVDSDKLSSAIAESTITAIGLGFITADTGEEGIEKAKNDDFELIVADLHLSAPEDEDSTMSGEDMLKVIAENGKKTPVVVITGKDVIDDIAMDPKWFDLNVKGFIQKGNPFWAEELKDKVKELLAIV
jgi:CheY-like chemotaxis protein/DNA-directed RNA polymerase subunit RPC12/RpoP